MLKGVLDGDNKQYFICQNGLRTLFCNGYKKIEISFICYQSTNYESSSKYKESQNASFSYTSKILEYLTEVTHEESESQATRFVRTLTGIGICNDKKFGETPPPYKTKRKMSKQYCFNNWYELSHHFEQYYVRMNA